MKNLSNQDFLVLIYKFLKDLKIEGKDFAKLAEQLKKNSEIEPEKLVFYSIIACESIHSLYR